MILETEMSIIADRRHSAIISPAEKILGAETPLKDPRKRSGIFSLFSLSSTSSPRKSPSRGGRSDPSLSSLEKHRNGSRPYSPRSDYQRPSPDNNHRSNGLTGANGRNARPGFSPTNPTLSSRSQRQHSMPTSSPPSATSSFPSIETYTHVSPTTHTPSQKFLLHMPLSLALRTATIATQLPVVQAAINPTDPQPGKKYKFFFGGSHKPTPSPKDYEFGGRSTFALVHGSILRYHSAFGDDPDQNATPTSTHFLNGSSIVFVTDAIQGFKWVLEVKTSSKGHTIRSPIKRPKSNKDLRDRNVDLTDIPWGVVDGVQVWYMVFETPNLMTEWMTLLRAAVADLKAKGEKSPMKRPKSVKSPSDEKHPTIVKSPGARARAQPSSPATSVSESLPSSPSSSRRSFVGQRMDGFLSKRNSGLLESATEEHAPSLSMYSRHSSHQSGALDQSPSPTHRTRQQSRQDIALTAFRISAFEEDLEGFMPPAVELPHVETRVQPSSIRSDSEHSHHSCNHTPLSPNLSYYSHKRASIISLQSRLSSVSSGFRTPNPAVSPALSSAPLKIGRRRLRRTNSGESQLTNKSWKQHQNVPPPYPPPTGPLPEPPSQPAYIHTSYQSDLFGRRPSSGIFDRRESLMLGVSPVIETETPRTTSHLTPRSSPIVPTSIFGRMGPSISSPSVKVVS